METEAKVVGGYDPALLALQTRVTVESLQAYIRSLEKGPLGAHRRLDELQRLAQDLILTPPREERLRTLEEWKELYRITKMGKRIAAHFEIQERFTYFSTLHIVASDYIKDHEEESLVT